MLNMSSDDEEYFDEFDEEDIFWVEESEPTAADDLAATATYDPAFQGDPSLETVEFFSDWEELSDDYYDEDPTVVRRLRAMGAWPIKQSATSLDDQPTKRRKIAKDPFTDANSFQSVIWRYPTDETDTVEIYAPGDGEKVSLLKNWREVFRNAKPAIGRLRGQKARLRVLDREQSEPELDSPELIKDLCEVEMVAADPQPAKSAPSSPIHAHVVVNSPSELAVYPKKVELGKPNGDIPKRPLKPIKEEDQASAAEAGGTNPETSAEGAENTSTATSRTGRKRKASVSIDEHSNNSQNEAGVDLQPKSKRTAPSKEAQTTKTLPASSGPVRRSARHRK